VQVYGRVVRFPYTPVAAWMYYVLFLKKSLTSLELKSRTGTWCSAGALLCAAGAAPPALPLPPQALPGAVGVACCRPPSLVELFALELRS
jgi:hypothetical protein